MRAHDIPEIVRQKAGALGAVGQAWLAGLDETVQALEAGWGVRIGATLSGGSEALVAEATTAEGHDAVVKVWLPEVETAASEVRTLLEAGGRGFAAVLAHDALRGAVLMERLGPSLASLGRPISEQITILCEALREAWVPTPSAGFTTGAEKAASLSMFIAALWQELGGPCSADVRDRAIHHAATRAIAFDATTAVLGHGDGHPGNLLQVPGEARQFKFVDPDGLFIERAYDLGIIMRDWSEDLLAGDTAALGLMRCRILAGMTGVPAAAIWQWGFIERVSTGLYLVQLGLQDEGRAMLAVAERWADVNCD